MATHSSNAQRVVTFFVCFLDQPGMVANEASTVPVRELCLARQVRPSHPASTALLFSTLRRNLVLTYHQQGILAVPRRRPFIYYYLYRQPPSGQSRVYSVTNCVPKAFSNETGKFFIADGKVEFCEATPNGLVDEPKVSLYGRETDQDLRSACRCVA